MVCLICRLEKIVFGDTSDIVHNLLNDKSETKINDESVDVIEEIVDKNDEKDKEDSKDSEDESDHDTSILSSSDDSKSKKKKAAWIDEDDYNYT